MSVFRSVQSRSCTASLLIFSKKIIKKSSHHGSYLAFCGMSIFYCSICFPLFLFFRIRTWFTPSFCVPVSLKLFPLHLRYCLVVSSPYRHCLYFQIWAVHYQSLELLLTELVTVLTQSFSQKVLYLVIPSELDVFGLFLLLFYSSFIYSIREIDNHYLQIFELFVCSAMLSGFKEVLLFWNFASSMAINKSKRVK